MSNREGHKGYVLKQVFMKNTIDVEKYYVWGNVSGGIRGEKKKLTPETIEKNNARVAAKKLKRLINNNFDSNDYHLTLTYKIESRPNKEGAHKVLQKFLRKMKREYTKRGLELKYIVVTEYMSKSIHHHLIINGFVEGGETAVSLVNKAWTYGRPKFVSLDEEGDYGQLADYLIKETQKTFRDKDHPGKQRYSRSRNLKIPKEKKKKMKSKEWRREPQPPKGYYIDKNSFYNGINEITGRRCQYYTCIRIRGGS